MFRASLAIAGQFTFPVIVSRRTVKGDCSSSIGTFVVVNDQGWIVTAGHMLRQLFDLQKEVVAVASHSSTKQTIENDKSIDRAEKKRRLQSLKAPAQTDTKNCSAWWHFPGAQLKDFTFVSPMLNGFGDLADIGVGRLEPFDPSWVQGYPLFKDPTKDFEPGTSLCKLGYPFHSVTPVWKEATQSFDLPLQALPLPRFPMDGIFTRQFDLDTSGTGLSFPVRYIETSTPGLRGQSGGPTIDTKGTIWAIQAKTQHLPLGFDPPVPGGKTSQREHQFLNTGLGVHPETIFALFDQLHIGYQKSPY